MAGKLKAVRAFLIDVDGVLYVGRRPMPGAAEFIRHLREEGIPFLLLTNNSTRTPAQYVAKLLRMGIEVEEEHIFTSAQATALYLEEEAPGATVYVIGMEGLRQALMDKGFRLVEKADGVDFVVVGMDIRLTYEKLRQATLAIRRGARFIGTNPDKTFPAEEGIVPGNGAILAALEAASGVAPTIIGKPERAIFELALKRLGTSPPETAVVGDRLDTDVLGGQRAGLVTILILSGITTPDDLRRSPIRPHFVFQNLKRLLEEMAPAHHRQ